MEVLIVLSLALNLSIRLTLPKLKLIWKGEKVVVSRLLREHRQTVQAKNNRQTTSGPVISGLDSSMPPLQSSGVGMSNPANNNNNNTNPLRQMEEGSQKVFAGDDGNAAKNGTLDPPASTIINPGALPSIDEDKSAIIQPEQPRPLRKRIVVQPGHAPPSKLTMQLLSHTNNAQHVNEKVLSGYQVEGSDWKKLAKSVDKFQALLQGYEFEASATN